MPETRLNRQPLGQLGAPRGLLSGQHETARHSSNGVNDPLVTGLRALGHTVSVAGQSSGVSTIIRVPSANGATLVGGADPRREGIALGDAP